MGKRTLPTAEHEEVLQRNVVLASEAEAILADEDATAVFLAAHGSIGTLRRLSARNQILLLIQGDERGVTVTDVESYRGWLARGRRVCRGAKAFYIVAPRGTGLPEDAKTSGGADSPDRGKVKGRLGFRMTARFDISQTADLATENRGAHAFAVPA